MKVKPMSKFLATAALVTALVAGAPTVNAQTPTTTANFTVEFTGIATPTGAVLLSLYDSEAAFDQGGKPVRVAMLPVTGATVQQVFEGLPAGQYAIKALHDIDGDGRMAANPFGMPTEPFAFSNNAVGNMGPAKWAAAVFAVAPGANRHSIVIR